MPLQNQGATVTNLATHTFTAQNTDFYTIQCTLQLPNVTPTATTGPGGGAGTGTGGGPQVASQVVCTVKQNGTTKLSTNPGDRGFEIQLNCTAGDVITIVRTSSLLQDELLNVIQMTLAISEGI
jgi:hypothetical protein